MSLLVCLLYSVLWWNEQFQVYKLYWVFCSLLWCPWMRTSWAFLCSLKKKVRIVLLDHYSQPFACEGTRECIYICMKVYFLYYLKLKCSGMCVRHFARMEFQGKLKTSADKCWACVSVRQAGILLYILMIWDVQKVCNWLDFQTMQEKFRCCYWGFFTVRTFLLCFVNDLPIYRVPLCSLKAIVFLCVN